MNPRIASFLSEVEPGFLTLAVITEKISEEETIPSMAVITKKISEEETIPTKNLPEELIADILSRLPVKSLLKFRCVCKAWCALITDPGFVNEHLNRSLARNSNRSLIFSRRCLVSLDLDSCEQEEEVELDYPLKGPGISTEVLGSCNGLLCISNFDEDILFWNPSIRRHHEVPFTPIEFRRGSGINLIGFGFGYDPTTDDYKLVRVVQFYGEDEYSYSRESEVKIYSLSTNSWRRVGDMPYCLTSTYAVLANYALHWVAIRKTGPDAASRFIVSFDLRDEEYREVPMPDFVGDEFHMTLGVLGGQLCFLRIFSDVRVEVWVMKDYGVRDSWVKEFSLEHSVVPGRFDYIRPVCYSKNGEVILDKPLILLDPRSGRVRSVRLCDARERNGTAKICVGSLVPLNTKDGTKRTATKKRPRGLFRDVVL